MAIKKTELYASLWASCDELRGGMDASQYKNYILTLLFVKYVSDKYANQKRGAIVVPKGGSFADMVAQKGQKNIGEELNKIVSKLAAENDMAWLSGTDNDFQNEERLGKGQAMVDVLSNLVGIFENLNLGKNQADGDDLLGDAYEYLMRHFATESGKSKGQFYTPSEVSRILSKVLGINNSTRQDETVYDPTCGSGSLLLKVNDEAPNGLSLFGQEKENATAALAKMNVVIHKCPSADIWQDDTISEPHWKGKDGGLQTFDYAVANPPFSLKSWSSGITPANDRFNRFEYGVPPEKNGDYAFLLHIIKSLKSTGKGAVILPHGVLFRGNAEADIRRNIIRQGYIKGIIGLPANLFYGTSIPACIIVIDKKNSGAKKPIFMIDASKGFIKDGNKNRLRAQDIHKIVDVFNKQLVIDRYSRLVPYSEIAEKNEFNLNIPRYIDSSDPEDIHDLDAHLNGGIPIRDIDLLQNYWDVFPTLRKKLFSKQVRAGYVNALVEARKVKASILNHDEFKTFKEKNLKLFKGWKSKHAEYLNNIEIGDKPREIIFNISEDLLNRFAKADLLNKYDIYQILMNYWVEVMQDDVYLLSQDGWRAGNTLRLLVPVKDKKGKAVYKEEHDFEFSTAKLKKRYKSDIVPPDLVIARYFLDKKKNLDKLHAEFDEITQKLESFIEENSGGDGLIEEAKNDKGSISKKTITDRIQVSKDKEEIAALKKCLSLIDSQSKAKSAIKTTKDDLDKLVFKKIPNISESELKDLVVNAKWFHHIEKEVVQEIERMAHQLAGRVTILEERYSETLNELNKELKNYSSLVENHLKKMGVSCKTEAMHQLITGKKRLAGFDGKWNKIKMEKDSSLKARIGWQALTTNEYLEFGSFHLVTGTDFFNGRVNWSTCHFVDEWRFNQDRNIQLKEGDVLLTKDGTIGKVGYVDKLEFPATLNSGVFVIRPVGDAFNPLFLYYILSSRVFDDFLSKITAGSTIIHLYQKDFVTFEFDAPELDEQEKIAGVLQDLDVEISYLEKRLLKARGIKQGMMQELLTGRTRLR